MGLIDSPNTGAGRVRGAPVAQPPGPVDAATGAVDWAWKHKGQLGLWAGAAALLLSVPLTGGRSSARAGSALAARGSAIASSLAATGRTGASAVAVARLGTRMVGSAARAVRATAPVQALASGSAAIRSARVALGSTQVGRAMVAAQRPVAAAGTIIAGANLADTSVRYARGEATTADLALSALAVAPAGLAGVRGVAARRAANANEAAARVAASALDDVAAQAASASDEVAHVASVAPTVAAPRTADAAAHARERAAGTLDRAVRLRERAALTARAPAADEAITASTIARELDEVAARAHAARAHAIDAEQLAPAALTPVARDARLRLDAAEVVTARAGERVQSIAAVQERAQRIAERADAIGDAAGRTSTHAANVRNLRRSDTDGSLSLTEGNAVRGLLSWLLGANARAPSVGAAR